MKKQFFTKLLSCLLFVCASFSPHAQTIKDFFAKPETPILYLGIDFTKTKLIDNPNPNVSDIIDRQYAGINDLIVTEVKKYDIRGAFRRNTLDHDLGLVNDRNPKADKDALVSTNTADFHRLKADDMTALVKSYDFKDKSGLGLLFVMEAMSKSGKAIAIWAVIIDMKSKKVLMAEREEGKIGMGIGFRNYWATAIKSAIGHMDDDYKNWKTKYGS